jgi:hypothetical protein
MKAFETVTAWLLGSRVVLLLLVVTLFSAIANAQTITLGEAVDNTSLTWTTGGDADWFGQTSVYYYDGDAAQSGDIASGQSSWIQTTVTGPGILAFYWRVSLGAQFDLKFYLDGVEKAECYAWDEWELRAYSIPSGDHTLRWVYAPFIHWTGDAGFLDKVMFISGSAIMVESPNGGETWYHRDFYRVRWAGTEDVAKVKIELWKGPKLHYVIAVNTDNDGYYKWFVAPTLTMGTDYRIKITSTSNSSIGDYSDSDFSIAECSTPPVCQSSFGGALVLGSYRDDAYAEAEDHPELDVGDEAGESLTIEAWFYDPGLSRRGDIIVKAGSYSLKAERYRYYDPQEGKVKEYGCIWFHLTPPSGQLGGFGTCEWPAYAPGWHHIAGVFYKETGVMSLYMDGERLGTQYFGPAINNSAEGLRVGGKLGGAVDEVRISDMARYTGSTYPVPMSPFTCDEHTRALWHFDEFEGATVFHDACGTADNVLVGYNGAHTEGVPVYRAYLSLIVKQY